MVNYNSWSEKNDKDSDDADVPAYTGAAYRPVEAPAPAAVEQEQQGVIFSRRVPLHELIEAQRVEADDTAESNDSDDEQPSAVPPRAYAPAPVEAVATEAHEQAVDSDEADDDEDVVSPLSVTPRPPTIRATASVPPSSRIDAAPRPQPVPTAEAPAAPHIEHEPSAFEPVAMPEYEEAAHERAMGELLPPPGPQARNYDTQPMTYEEAMAALTAPENEDTLTAAPQPLRPFRATAAVAPPSPALAPVEALTHDTEPAATVAPVASEHLIFGNNQREYGGTMAYSAGLNEERPKAAEEAPGERRNRRLVGLAFAAVGLEYFARRRDVRRSESRMNKQAEDNHRANERGQAFLQRQQQEFAAEQQRQGETLQQLRTQGTAQEQMTAMPLTYAEQQPAIVPQPIEAVRPPAAEQRPLPPIMVAPEARPATPETPLIMLQQQEAALQEEQPKLREAGDAWRHYMVDEHNREVATARTYGEAYHQERAQEIIRDRTADDDDTTSTTSSASAASAPAGAGSGAPSFVPSGSYASNNAGGGTTVPGLPSGMTTPSLPQGKATHVDPQHQLEAQNPKKEGIASNVTNPWFWLMLSLIVAAFFAAALI
ncbi:MAG TPA: hypothetical protein VD735_06970 [Candidatus Saccharimonadales bacterium]|nr:hypothetical protein [Candidatus Saccharimonadales bacterium]